ncbi:MAG: DNA-3-methyladenine glycosylase family protein [Solirubrobacteraceae bacterium]
MLDGTVDLARSSKLAGDELVAGLVTVRGIGRWTAEMFLLFELRRLDVWPVGDLGVRQGYGLAWRFDQPPLAKELAPLGERFRPYRSVSPATAGRPSRCPTAERTRACGRGPTDTDCFTFAAYQQKKTREPGLRPFHGACWRTCISMIPFSSRTVRLAR